MFKHDFKSKHSDGVNAEEVSGRLTGVCVMVQVETLSEGEFGTWVVKEVYIKSMRLPDWNGFIHKTAEGFCNAFYSTVPHVYILYINNNFSL